MNNLVLSLVLLVLVLILASVGTWILAKKFGVTSNFRIYLVGIVVIIIIATFTSLSIKSFTDNKNNGTDNKEEIEFQL